MSVQWHQMVERLNSNWFYFSSPIITAASSANLNQLIGLNVEPWVLLKQKQSWQNVSDFMSLMNVLKHTLNKRGLRQSPCNTPRSTVIYEVLKSDVTIEVWKTLHKLLIKFFIWEGTWGWFKISFIRLWWTSQKAFLTSNKVKISDRCFIQVLLIICVIWACALSFQNV